MPSHAESRATWQGRLAAQAASGLPVSVWCAQQGIKRKRFYHWRQRLQTPTLAGDANATHWLPVTLCTPVDEEPAPVSSSSGITLQVGSVVIHVAAGFQSQVLRAVLATVEDR